MRQESLEELDCKKHEVRIKDSRVISFDFASSEKSMLNLKYSIMSLISINERMDLSSDISHSHLSLLKPLASTP